MLLVFPGVEGVEASQIRPRGTSVSLCGNTDGRRTMEQGLQVESLKLGASRAQSASASPNRPGPTRATNMSQRATDTSQVSQKRPAWKQARSQYHKVAPTHTTLLWQGLQLLSNMTRVHLTRRSQSSGQLSKNSRLPESCAVSSGARKAGVM